MLTIPQAAKALGLTESTLRSWILNRRIAYAKLGKSVRISEAEVERVISESTVTPRVVAAELDPNAQRRGTR